jgi:hypothetical protein
MPPRLHVPYTDHQCLVALVFSKFFEAMRMTLRSFQMQLSKKTAMLFFIYLMTAFTSQTEIFDSANPSGKPIRTPKNDLPYQSSGNIVGGKFYWLRECDAIFRNQAAVI